jgi:hypothetical protein
MIRSSRIAVFAGLVGLVLSQPAVSADRSTIHSTSQPMTSQPMSPRIQLAQASVMTVRTVDPACFCWANGERFNRGESACLRFGGSRVLAQCDQVTNVMSWSFTQNPCPDS